MSFDPDDALITKILETGDLRSVLKSGITEEFLFNEDACTVFEWLQSRYQKFGKVPSLKLLQKEFPDFEPVDIDDDLPLIIDQVKQKKLYVDITQGLKKVQSETRADAEQGLNELRDLAMRLSVHHAKSATDIDFARVGRELRRDYERRARGDGMRGIPWPWEKLNRSTLGIRDGQFIPFYGRPKSMKTWVLLWLALWLYEFYQLRCIIFTKEMLPKELRERMAAIWAKVDWKRYEAGRLRPDEYRRFKRMTRYLKLHPPFPVVYVQSQGPAAVAEIRAKVEEAGVDIVFVDGLIYLAKSMDWKDFADVCNGMKLHIAAPLKVPVIATTHANRAGAKHRGGMEDVAFGDQLSVVADLLVRIVREPQQKEMREIILTASASRNTTGFRFAIHAKPGSDFSQKRVEELEEEYDGDEDGEGGEGQADEEGDNEL